MGLRTESTMTASGIRKVSLEWVRRRRNLRNENELSVRRVLLTSPSFSRPGGATGGNDALRAEDARGLHCNQPDDTGRTEHEHPLAALHVGAPLDREPAGQPGDAERRGQRVVGAVR